MPESNKGRAKPKPSAKAKAAEPDEPRYAPECYACPIGTVSMAIQRSTPETTEHLVRAGRELVLALRGVLDGLTDFLTVMEERTRGARGPSIESIPIRRPS